MTEVIGGSVQLCSSVMSDSLRPHGLQHTKPPCPSPTPKAYSNSCPLSCCCNPTISSSVVPFSSCPPILPSISVFSNESLPHIRWPKYWSFSFNISPSNEYSQLICFRIDWLHLSTFTFMHWRRKWQPTPVFLPGKSQGLGILVGWHLWGRTESDMTEAT